MCVTTRIGLPLLNAYMRTRSNGTNQGVNCFPPDSPDFLGARSTANYSHLDTLILRSTLRTDHYDADCVTSRMAASSDPVLMILAIRSPIM